MNVYLDTNLFIALIEGPNVALQEAIWTLFSSDEQSAIKLVTSELALAEVLVKPFAVKSDTLASAYMDLLQPAASQLSVISVSREVPVAAAHVRGRDKSIRLPDAIHLATAEQENCSIFLTADRALRQKRPDLCQPLSVESVEQILEGGR